MHVAAVSRGGEVRRPYRDQVAVFACGMSAELPRVSLCLHLAVASWRHEPRPSHFDLTSCVAAEDAVRKAALAGADEAFGVRSKRVV